MCPFVCPLPLLCPFVCSFPCPSVSESRRIRMRRVRSGSSWRLLLVGSILLLFSLLLAPPTARRPLSSSLDSSLLAHCGGVLGVTFRLRMLDTAGDSRAVGRGRCVDDEEESWYRFAAGAEARGRAALLPDLPVGSEVRGAGGGATFFRMVTVRVLILGLLGSNMAG